MMGECPTLCVLSSPVPLVKTIFYLFKNEKFNMHKLQVSKMKPTFPGCKPEQQMMYAGSKNKLVQTVELTKVSSNTRNLTHSDVSFLTAV